jgi:hypothetical protein
MVPDVSVILGLVFLGIALLLLILPRFRRRSTLPQQQHALIASHMRTYSPRKRA